MVVLFVVVFDVVPDDVLFDLLLFVVLFLGLFDVFCFEGADVVCGFVSDGAGVSLGFGVAIIFFVSRSM